MLQQVLTAQDPVLNESLRLQLQLRGYGYQTATGPELALDGQVESLAHQTRGSGMPVLPLKLPEELIQMPDCLERHCCNLVLAKALMEKSSVCGRSWYIGMKMILGMSQIMCGQSSPAS